MKEIFGLAILLITVFCLVIYEGMYVSDIAISAEETLKNARETKYTIEEVMEKTNGAAAGW